MTSAVLLCQTALITIVVINVRNKIKKTLKNAFLIPKIKKTFVNVIKNVTLFLLAFGIGSID